jgi:hypothetical protein
MATVTGVDRERHHPGDFRLTVVTGSAELPFLQGFERHRAGLAALHLERLEMTGRASVYFGQVTPVAERDRSWAVLALRHDEVVGRRLGLTLPGTPDEQAEGKAKTEHKGIGANRIIDALRRSASGAYSSS